MALKFIDLFCGIGGFRFAFEQAAASSSSFCFSTTIHLDGAPRQPVFCVGESTGLEEKYSGSIIGVFIFPRFQIDLVGRRFKRQ